MIQPLCSSFGTPRERYREIQFWPRETWRGNKGGCHREPLSCSSSIRPTVGISQGAGDEPGWGYSHSAFCLCVLEDKWTSPLVPLFSVWERTQIARRQGAWNFCEGGLGRKETVLKFVTPNPSNSLLTILGDTLG